MATYSHKREFSRVSTHISVEVMVGKDKIVSGDTHDVSVKGLFLSCAQRPAIGTDCRVALFLGGRESGTRARAAGKVARVTPEGIGIEFTEVDLNSLEHLRNLIRHNTNQSELVEKEFKDHLGLKPRK